LFSLGESGYLPGGIGFEAIMRWGLIPNAGVFPAASKLRSRRSTGVFEFGIGLNTGSSWDTLIGRKAPLFALVNGATPMSSLNHLLLMSALPTSA
jgi:hypothetical protein